MTLDRAWYVETVRHWMAVLEERWDEERGYYRIPQSTRSNGKLILPMLVLLNEGEERWKERILRVAGRMVQSPPYDERYRYFNWNMNQTGGEIHQAGSMTQIGLGFVLRHGERLELGSALQSEIARELHDSLERLAEFGGHATESEIGMTVEQDGTQVDITAERTEKIARGLAEDFGRLRQIGPSNQTCWEMRACVYAWEATGQEEYLDFADLLWRSVLRARRGTLRIGPVSPRTALSSIRRAIRCLATTRPCTALACSASTPTACGSCAGPAGRRITSSGS
jgi:hypothetical protein